MAEALIASRGHGANLMPWQAAPPRSTLRVLGQNAALKPESERIQAGLRGQGHIDDDWALSRMQNFPQEMDSIMQLRQAVAETQPLRGAHMASEGNVGPSGMSEMAAVLLRRPYLAATLPFQGVRERAIARKIDEGLGGTDADLRRVMEQNPQLDSLLIALQSLLKPAQVGAMKEPDLEVVGVGGRP